MKFTKMSLVAALLVGSSAFALENVKISGDAQLFYSTNDGTVTSVAGVNAAATQTETGDLFGDNTSAADAGVHLGLTADLVKGISAGTSLTALTTLGLENNLVNQVWGSAHSASNVGGNTNPNSNTYNAKVDNNVWFNEAWVATTVGNSTVKLGRMELDTPLAFTEKWSIERNTFEAAVLINQDLPDTTIVGAYVGNGNGTEGFGYDQNGTVQAAGLAVGGVVNENGAMQTYGAHGAYAFGIINNTYKPLVAQAWYYDVSKVAQAYWLQADVKVDNMLFGAQYTDVSADATDAKGNNAISLMAGYVAKDLATVKVAYSSTSSDGALGHAAWNTATAAATAQSKLYTEAWWNYGYVTKKNNSALHASVEGSLEGYDLGLYATKVDDKVDATANGDQDMTEIAVTASRNFGPLNTTVAYINTDLKAAGGATSTNVNTLQAYLTLNF
jgi:hypothetical protein